MDKNAIKKFAVWARRELITRVSQRAVQYEITENGYGDYNAESVNGRIMSLSEKSQRKALIDRIRNKGYEQVMEEVAYTWFNRFSALRFMEVNGYLPSRVRVFTDDDNNFKPQIITDAIDLNIDGLDMEKVYALKDDATKEEELYKYLLITQCNALSAILPKMFEKISDYTELLFPDNLLREGSVIQQMIEIIPEEDWKDAVQIIGWLYQYYNSEKKDEVFAALKNNVKITKDNIPAATQLFTPDWIVRYMVENSLGRLWVEGHPNDELKSNWKYYIEEAEQEADVQSQLAEIRKEYANIKPEDIKVIDPCSGSGHILAYLFDVLMQIYDAYGYTTREAVDSIVTNNIYGLEIDERAAQLAYFAVMMQARKYDSRFLKRTNAEGNLSVPQANIYQIEESNNIDNFTVEYFCNGDKLITENLNKVISVMYDAKEYGSLIQVEDIDFNALYKRFDEVEKDVSFYKDFVRDNLLPIVKVSKILSMKYDIVITNPPYKAVADLNIKLSDFIKLNYPDSKVDMFAAFIERCGLMTTKNGYQAMITQSTWMFSSSYENLRRKLLLKDIINMAHLGPRAFEEIKGEVVRTTSFILQNSHTKDFKGIYCRLIEPTTQQGKEDMFLAGENRYTAQQINFPKIPGTPVAYWVSQRMSDAFSASSLSEYAQCCTGMQTGNNEKYVRNWFELNILDTTIVNAKGKYCKYNCGGESRKWYGNHKNVVLWQNNGELIRSEASSVIRNERFYFNEGITWKRIGSSTFALRYLPKGFIFDQAGDSMFPINSDKLLFILAFTNTKVAVLAFEFIAPTMNLTAGNMNKLPIIYDKNKEIDKLALDNIELAKSDWDSFEISWDFVKHPLKQPVTKIEQAFTKWEIECNERFNQLKANEEELNRIFIDIYALKNELTPEVEDKDVTVRKADLQRDIKSFVSYAVGCMFGRYSLDVEGLAYAGGEWVTGKYQTFKVDSNNIIPICDDEYFKDDIVGRFIEFVKTVYGADNLEENLKFIADALGGSGQTREVIRNYFIKDFYADHCKIYQKRPIYWLFDSGKKNGFKALIYMHRYQQDTIARMRTDYVHEQQARYRTALEDLEHRINGASGSEKVKLDKRMTKLRAQIEEIGDYEEKIHHLADQMIDIDLDDGVKHNYEIFKDVLAKIK